jgi:hypothetical protein
MIIELSRKTLKKHPILSHYDNDYWELPFTVIGCDVLHSRYLFGDDWDGYSIGIEENGKFIEKFFLHTGSEFADEVEFDSDAIKYYNEWG